MCLQNKMFSITLHTQQKLNVEISRFQKTQIHPVKDEVFALKKIGSKQVSPNL